MYRSVWDCKIGDILTCELEENNRFDKHAVALKKGSTTVGHVPRSISKTFYHFIRRGGAVTGVVEGKHENNGVGLEIPATYVFIGDSNDTHKLITILDGKV